MEIKFVKNFLSTNDFEEVVNGDSIRQEFREWLDIEKESHVLSLEYIDDADSGVDIIEI